MVPKEELRTMDAEQHIRAFRNTWSVNGGRPESSITEQAHDMFCRTRFLFGTLAAMSQLHYVLAAN